MFIIIIIIIMQDSYTDEDWYSCDLHVGYYTFSTHSCQATPKYSCILSTQNDGISASHNYNLN